MFTPVTASRAATALSRIALCASTTELRALKAPQKDTLVGVLQYLSDHIRATRLEISTIKGGAHGDQLFGSTADELIHNPSFPSLVP